mmetsp:Transcript_3385/g.9172  ORF Transcript_3385/g.9172 Transcript_3385/m.9172 type:complete len:320 (+) Transcript_3385:45-1004(+)
MSTNESCCHYEGLDVQAGPVGLCLPQLQLGGLGAGGGLKADARERVGARRSAPSSVLHLLAGRRLPAVHGGVVHHPGVLHLVLPVPRPGDGHRRPPLQALHVHLHHVVQGVGPFLPLPRRLRPVLVHEPPPEPPVLYEHLHGRGHPPHQAGNALWAELAVHGWHAVVRRVQRCPEVPGPALELELPDETLQLGEGDASPGPPGQGPAVGPRGAGLGPPGFQGARDAPGHGVQRQQGLPWGPVGVPHPALPRRRLLQPPPPRELPLHRERQALARHEAPQERLPPPGLRGDGAPGPAHAEARRHVARPQPVEHGPQELWP